MIRLLVYIICNLSSLTMKECLLSKALFSPCWWKLKLPDITCDSIYLVLIINLDLLVLLQLVCHPPSQHEKHQSSCKQWQRRLCILPFWTREEQSLSKEIKREAWTRGKNSFPVLIWIPTKLRRRLIISYLWKQK